MSRCGLRAFAASLAAGLIVLAGPAMGDASPREDHDAISGSNLRAIQAAMPEASKVMADLDEYVIHVVQRDEATVVVFADRENVDLLVVGSGGRIPEFEIELDKDDLQFVRLTYTR